MLHFMKTHSLVFHRLLPLVVVSLSLSETRLHAQNPPNLGSFNILINPGSGLTANTAALSAFNRAAQQWMAYFSDPITININANLSSLSADLIGSTRAVIVISNFDDYRDRLVTDASDEVSNSIVGALPTAGQFIAALPVGFSLTGNLAATKANLKAIGVPNLDSFYGTSDAEITFNSAYTFDYDNSDGVGAGLVDFETVAAHEIGHALGFFSSVDEVVAGFTSITPSLLDLFRFRDGPTTDPSTSSQFTTLSRDLTTNGVPIFDDTSNEWRMSVGFTEDGRQASHWKDDGYTGVNIGMMDPTLSPGEIFAISAADLRAFDLIGYELVPEPSALAMSALCCVIFTLRRNRRESPQTISG
jgi:hypothetical protein